MGSGARRDLVLALLVAAFAVLLLLALIPFGVDVPGSVRAAVLSPALWPRVIAGFMLVMALLLVLQSALALRRGDVAAADEIPSAPDAAFKVGAACLLLVVYYFAIEPLGMVLATVLAILAFGYLAGERRHLLLLAVAVGLPLLLHAFFFRVAGIPLPAGVLAGIL